MAVLLLAPERDTTADRMVRELTHRRVPFVRMDTAWFPGQVSLAATFTGGVWAAR
jgi:hypothetical protein